MDKQKQAYLYAVAAVLMWSTVASAFKISLRYLDPLQLLLIASFVSALVLFVILLAQNKLHRLNAFSKRDYLHSALLGLLNPFAYYAILFKAYDILPAQEAQPLNYTWPIMLVLLSVPLLKQSISIKSVFAIIVSFVGVLVISTQGNVLEFRVTNLNGALLALSTAIIWALFWIYNTTDSRDEVVKLFMNFLFGFVYILITTMIFSDITLPETAGLLGAIYVGVFEMGVTFIFWSKALKLSSSTAKVSKLIFLAPFLSLIFIYFIVGEQIRPSTVIGLFFIVSGIVLEQIFNRRERSKS